MDLSHDFMIDVVLTSRPIAFSSLVSVSLDVSVRGSVITCKPGDMYEFWLVRGCNSWHGDASRGLVSSPWNILSFWSTSYNSSVSYKILDKEEVLNVISTYPLDNSTLLIESLIDNNQVDFELNFENSGFTGTAGGYYDLEGEKIE